jgi:DinB superfamily
MKSYWEEAGFFNDVVDVKLAEAQLDKQIIRLPLTFSSFASEELLKRPAPGKWSRKEILGHLIDSAINNLKRFTEIQFLPQPFYINSYKQDDLVRVNHYQDLPIDHLLDLWKALNKQIIYVINNIPEEKLGFPVDPQYDNGEMKTLGWIICDYVAHMEHHMKQV